MWGSDCFSLFILASLTLFQCANFVLEQTGGRAVQLCGVYPGEETRTLEQPKQKVLVLYIFPRKGLLRFASIT